MNKWIAEFDLEDGDTMPECMDLEYKGAKLDFHCRPMWIPVSERLPEEDEDVLVQMTDYSMMVDFRTASSSGWFWAEKDDLPMAWMPLPEPYKVESEE